MLSVDDTICTMTSGEVHWNSSNARDFIEYTISKGYPVDSWEFGNELSGHGVGASVGAEQYGKNVINLSAMIAILDDLYKISSSRASLVAPGGFFDPQWYAEFLEVSGSGVVNAMTHHIYNLGGVNESQCKANDNAEDPAEDPKPLPKSYEK